MKIALIGDIGLFGKYTLDNLEIKEYFKEVSLLLSSADVVIGNLEVPLCNVNTKKIGKSAHIKSDPKNTALLKYLNISHVSLANNHLYDFGKQGYYETVENLKKNNIKYFGIENKEEYLEYGENKIALSGYVCYSTNALGYLENNKIGVNELDFSKVKENLLKNHKNGYLNIASFHIGEEHIHYPNIDHVRMARKLSCLVPYVFYGHHPHVLQGIESYKDSIHFFSLGNFCFDDVYTSKSHKPLVEQQKVNKESAIIMLTIENNSIEKYKIIPIFDNGNKIEISIGGKIEKKIQKYSKYLTLNEEQYNEERSFLISSYINKRKSLRNLTWYVKRLQLGTFIMIKNSRKNRKKYIKLFQREIAEKEH